MHWNKTGERVIDGKRKNDRYSREALVAAVEGLSDDIDHSR